MPRVSKLTGEKTAEIRIKASATQPRISGNAKLACAASRCLTCTSREIASGESDMRHSIQIVRAFWIIRQSGAVCAARHTKALAGDGRTKPIRTHSCYQ